MRLIFSCFFSVVLNVGFLKAQQEPLPLAKQSFKPTGIRVGTDLIDVVKTFSGSTFKGWEVNGDLGLRNYYVTADVGSWAKNLSIANGSYHNSGTYFRLGVDINLLGKDPDKNMFFFGFRYGRSFFSENISYADTTLKKIFPNANIQNSNGNVFGGWVELTTGLRVRVWKSLWMGYTARMKFAPSTKGSSPSFAPYDMPGYGITSQTPWWGFNYQVFWKFDWKKKYWLKKNDATKK